MSEQKKTPLEVEVGLLDVSYVGMGELGSYLVQKLLNLFFRVLFDPRKSERDKFALVRFGATAFINVGLHRIEKIFVLFGHGKIVFDFSRFQFS